ncbi:MAG: pyridoxamine 5'-phosphate oxidase family protein [Pseudomonadota bacterium]
MSGTTYRWLASLISALAWLPAIAYCESELNPTTDTQLAIAEARRIISDDPFVNLATVDDKGQARIRTMEHSGADEDMVVYLATIPNTRKLTQIKTNNKVTLFFDNADETAYVSIMGTASIHNDAATIIRHAWQTPKHRTQFWPEFPKGYVLIRVQPDWMEVITSKIAARDSDWRPQAVQF